MRFIMWSNLETGSHSWPYLLTLWSNQYFSVHDFSKGKANDIWAADISEVIRCLVSFDTYEGTTGKRDLVAKLRSYEHYVASREWFKQEATLPLLLMVTPDTGQERCFSRVVTATLNDRCGLFIRTTTLTRACEHRYLGPIWSQELLDSEGTNPIPRRMFYL
jgi:hypothetical protein